MPEFILDHGTDKAARTFSRLDSFTQGYIEAMFFTNTGSGDDGDLEDATVADLAKETLAEIIADCQRFQLDHAELLDQAYARNYDNEQAGRDYWFSRNGHGVGFWDRSELDADGLGDKLTAVCQYQTRDLYRGDDGKVYLA